MAATSHFTKIGDLCIEVVNVNMNQPALRKLLPNHHISATRKYTHIYSTSFARAILVVFLKVVSMFRHVIEPV